MCCVVAVCFHLLPRCQVRETAVLLPMDEQPRPGKKATYLLRFSCMARGKPNLSRPINVFTRIASNNRSGVDCSAMVQLRQRLQKRADHYGQMIVSFVRPSVRRELLQAIQGSYARQDLNWNRKRQLLGAHIDQVTLRRGSLPLILH